MTLDADTIEALGYGDHFGACLDGLLRRASIRAARRRRYEETERPERVHSLRAYDTREVKRARTQRLRAANPEHYRELNREAAKRYRERRKREAR